ncbi:GAF domain-containing protein [Myxococcota bacterium]|nr:GAF domain-containing protein [Myxococcota bacterium]
MVPPSPPSCNVPITDEKALSAAEYALLGRVAEATEARPFPDWLGDVLELLRAGAGADASEMFLLDRGEGAMRLAGCAGPDSDAFGSLDRFEPGVGYPGIVAATRRALIGGDLAKDTRYLRVAVPARGYRSYAATPLLRGDRLLGTLSLAWKGAHHDAEQRGIRLLQAIARVVATALVAARGDLEGPTPVDGARPVAEWLQDQARRLRALSKADEVSIALLHPDARGIVDCGSTGSSHVLCPRLAASGPDACPLSDSLKRGLVLAGPRGSWPSACRCAVPTGFSQVVEVPLRRGREVHGYACLAWGRAPAEPPARLLASLLFMEWSVPANLRPEPSPPALPAILAPMTAAGTHHLGLQCFGPFTVYVDGLMVHRRAFTRAKAVDILKTLILCQGRPISRDALVERLWPDADIEAGARSLHVAMHDLRRVVEPERPGRRWDYVLSQGDTFFLDLGSNCSVDLRDWRDLLAAARGARARGEGDAEVLRLLERAVSLYRGDLFADDLDSQWFIAARETCRDQFIDALVQLSILYERGGEPDRAVLALRQAVEADPLREAPHQRLVEALQRGRRVEEARAAYEAYLQTAWRASGAPRSPAMRHLGTDLGFDSVRERLSARM